ncbi:Uncharacterised protein [Leclercia adecarboxylata]|uniref:Uncharacterized protein n=1 Tax=Leclercia adecarboxylata TaxID=83655 RepID=A0A4U9HGB8_9ENTR|nr:Uncharacterised protein [Leclercia adecarboxylata]
MFGPVCTQAMRHLITFDAADGEDAALLYFAQECSLFAQRSGYGNTQYDFIHIFRQLGGSSIQIKFNLWLPVFLENMWRIWCFVGDVFGVNALDLEVISVLFCSDMEIPFYCPKTP